MAPPRGPRGGGTRAARNNNAGSRPNRGGISKRKGPGAKTDPDGDMEMDSEGRRAKRPATGGDTNPPKRGRPSRSSAPASTRLPAKQTEALVRHMNGNPLASRVSMPARRGQQKAPQGLVWLTVKGLKESRAADNPGGGVKDLLQFLERKSSALSHRSKNPVAIKQVSALLPDDFGGGSTAMPMVQTRPI